MTVSLSFDVAAAFGDEQEEAFRLDASLDVAAGETLVLLGPSGSGKTLLVECIAGFNEHTGTVEIDGRDVTDAPPERRDTGVVFQDDALFPHLSVRENVSFGARYHETTGDPDALLETLGVAELADRDPQTLSGGERRRIAVARALAVDPGVLVLDEPLAALDVPTRERLRGDLVERLADRTTVCVTHDRTTARALGDRVAVLADGHVRQVGTPATVFERPATPFVAQFVGANVVPSTVDWEDGGEQMGGPSDEATDDWRAIRPERVAVGDPTDAPVTGRVRRVVPTTTEYRVTVELDDAADCSVVATSTTAPTVGERVGLSPGASGPSATEGERPLVDHHGRE
ncbi:ABC transporter ATP-binding protein [Halobaculum sp. MBLA0147]|uniref:ABC transporter ATP-binding protein n=1 Tax=Halobaculum sp. MBLA0147 TaxID=3079934 RepID=UPI003523D089